MNPLSGTGKYEALLEKCRSLAPAPTAVFLVPLTLSLSAKPPTDVLKSAVPFPLESLFWPAKVPTATFVTALTLELSAW